MKRTVNILIWVLLITGIIVLGGFINAGKKKIICNNLEVTVNYDGADPVVFPGDIRKKVYEVFDSIEGKRFEDINLQKIEETVSNIKYVSRADVFTTLSGNLEIEVVQRKPVVRVINNKGLSFYIDENGVLFPLGEKYQARVIVASGNIDATPVDTLKLKGYEDIEPQEYDSVSTLQKIYCVARYINGDDFFKALIEQIYVNKDGDMELIPKVGRHRIIFGDIENLNEKFDNLYVFYHEGLKRKGWDKYKTVNLKYKNQVVCSK